MPRRIIEEKLLSVDYFLNYEAKICNVGLVGFCTCTLCKNLSFKAVIVMHIALAMEYKSLPPDSEALAKCNHTVTL